MSYDVYAYLIYLPIIFFITVRVGWLFYTHGEIYILALFKAEVHFTHALNNMLLTGYYLINLGYAAYTLKYWEPISSMHEVVSSVAKYAGTIILLLAIMHYINLAAIMWLGKSQVPVRRSSKTRSDSGLNSKTENHGKLPNS